MTNKDFEANELNHVHMQFYRQAVLNAHAQYVQNNMNTSEKIAQWAIDDAQALMRVMGYTNTMETNQ